MSEEMKRCPFCAEEILAVAKKCKHCGSILEGETTNDVTAMSPPAVNYTAVWLAIPIIAALVILMGTAGIAGFQLSANGIAGIVFATILGTALVAAIEASKVGMKMDRSKGTYGPVVWFIVMALLWIIAYPVYMFKRKHYGLPNRLVAALVVAVLFVLSPAIIDPAPAEAIAQAAEGVTTESSGEIETAQAAIGSNAFNCADHPELAQTADVTIRHVDNIKPLADDKKKLMGPDIQHSDFLSQKVPDKFVELCTGTAYYYDNTSNAIIYSVSLVNNDSEYFVAVQDPEKFGVSLTLARLHEQGEAERRQAAQQQKEAYAGEPQQETPPASAEPMKTAQETATTEQVKPSFDCNKATSKIDKLICQTPELAKWDGRLAESFHGRYSHASPQEKTELATTQKEWIKRRNQCETNQCIIDAYRQRDEELVPWEYEQHE
jgi:uncharacterized protein YecT (DUF1311 family)